MYATQFLLRQQVADRDLPQARIRVAPHVLREERGDRLIDPREVAALDGDPDQRAHDALRDRLDVDRRVEPRAAEALLCLDHPVARDYQRLQLRQLGGALERARAPRRVERVHLRLCAALREALDEQQRDSQHPARTARDPSILHSRA
jgi:hypothetical protein